MVSVRPWRGSVPANRTFPAAGAHAGSPAVPATSMPRCWPASYSLGATTNGASTAPDAGQLHARAAGDAARAATAVPGSKHA
jgi:hypothetical protein